MRLTPKGSAGNAFTKLLIGIDGLEKISKVAIEETQRLFDLEQELY